MTTVNPQMTRISYVAALSDGGAFVHNLVFSNRTEQVLRVNGTGQVLQHVHQCVRCFQTGLLELYNNLYIIHNKGLLIQININNINTVQVHQVPDVGWMINSGSLSYHPSLVTHPDLLLLTDHDKGEIFSYNVTSKNKQVHLTGLRQPSSVSFFIFRSHLYYVVCEQGNHQVHVYNSTWGLFQTLGRYGSGNGQLYLPSSAIGLPDGSVVITDYGNHRVCLFTIRGRFTRHLLTQSDGLLYPDAMSISLPYIWLSVGQHPDVKLNRYNLY